MKWIEAKVIFEFDDRQLAVDLISNLFYEFGLRGVVIEDPEIVPGEDWAQDAPDLPEQNAVIGFFPENDMSSKKLKIIEEKLHGLEKELGIASRIFYSPLDEADWSESWKSHFWPEKIGAGIVVKPTWREYVRAENETVLEIDPGMAFGTGTHPTTAMCIEMIETYLKRGDSFLDVGTGSGILMVAAAKLGAAQVRGVDNDDEAVKIARQNMLQNRIETKTFKVTAGNLVNGIDEPFNLVAANISSAAVINLLDGVGGVLAENGMFICSGIVAESKSAIVAKMETLGFDVIETRTKEGWVAIAARLIHRFF
ncbi:MAG: 50S ribosomal protein L11 methyltransferase [Proteobacteria bacterium]|nr:50S ribosomal protein L11 methyltransferase [Pseudomonadota bacterium]